MQCREVRDLADSFLSEELLVETNHEVLRHLEACPACQAEIASHRELRGAMRRAFTGAEALRMRDEFPREVVSRLRSVAPGGPARRLVTRWSAVAASLAMVAGVGLFLLRGNLAAMARDAVGDHRNCAVQFRLAEKPISLEDAARRYDVAYRRLLDTPPAEMTTPVGLVRVVDRHSCVFAGRRFAHVVLQFQGQLVSLLVTADDGRLTQRAAGADGKVQLAWLPVIDGFVVGSFRAPRHVAFVVSQLDSPGFRQLAQVLADPVYDRLAGA